MIRDGSLARHDVGQGSPAPHKEVAMAEVLQFPRLCAIPADPVRLRAGKSAQILFFTGVRYERHAEVARGDAMIEGSGPVADGDGSVPSQKRRRRG
jgi:hypothetical protein